MCSDLCGYSDCSCPGDDGVERTDATGHDCAADGHSIRTCTKARVHPTWSTNANHDRAATGDCDGQRVRRGNDDPTIADHDRRAAGPSRAACASDRATSTSHTDQSGPVSGAGDHPACGANHCDAPRPNGRHATGPRLLLHLSTHLLL